ncbi:TonB-dependent receptor [Iodidimonas nitroreducens]|uniref:TonB-dependent receptor n=1 Tax=Iodidimonas nitroreducens TaxID=1236968 RepID=UPI0006940B64|nr:TonB-dependent receptor [Iodidimonas nitroreducens]
MVTAQKRTQSLRDVPSSVATFGGDALDVLTSPGSDIRDLAGRVPSLNAEGSNGNIMPRFYIRGLGNTDFDLNASQPVGIYVDGVVKENVLLKSQMMFDIERIEVLRGPQGTLFGRNTPAGIVKIETRKPTHEFDAYALASYGRFNSFQFEGAMGGSIIDGVLAARVSGRLQHQDDYIDNLAENAPANTLELGRLNDIGGRVQFLYTPTENFSALLNFHARSFDGDSEIFRANIIAPGGGFVDGFRRDQVFQDGENDQGLDLRGASLSMDYVRGPLTFTSITGFENASKPIGRGDIDGGFGAAFLGEGNFGPGFIPFPSASGSDVPDLDQWTQEFRVAGEGLGIFDFQAGFFYFSDDIRINNFGFDTLNNNALNGAASQRQQTEAWGIFGSVDIHLTPRLTVAGGVRYTEEDKDFQAERTLGGPGPLPLSFRSTSDEVISWDASVNYDLSSNTTVYSRIARSFRAPSIQGRITFADDITVADSETILSIEAGFKTELFDNRLRLNVSAFNYDMDDQQLTAVGGDVNTARLLNAQDSDGRGFEMDAEWAVTSALRLTAGMSYNFTKINDPDIRVPFPGGINGVCPQTCVIDNPIVDGLISIDGNRLPNAPRWIANWTARYGIPFGESHEFYLFTDWALTTKSNFFLYNSQEFSNGTNAVGGVRMGAKLNDGRFDFALYGRNITDQTFLRGGIDFNNLTGFINPPPLWGVELRANF